MNEPGKPCRVCGTPVVEHDACEACVTEARALGAKLHHARYLAPPAPAETKAGDFVASVTKALGIPECGGCGKRRAAMNAVDLKGPAMTVFRGLTAAILNPEKVLNGGEEALDRREEEGPGQREGGSAGSGGEDPHR